MFETMILATDLSPDWDDILACAEEFKVLGCRKAVLTHVFMTAGTDEHAASVRGTVPPEMMGEKSLLEGHGFEVVVETPVGLPAQCIDEVAERHGASLVVVGSHGKSAWREALLGSVSNALLHHARFPILIINVKRLRTDDRGAICQLKTTELLRHVLYPTDFSEVASKGVAVLEHLVSRGLSRVTVLHSLEVVEFHPTAVLKVDEAPVLARLGAEADRLREVGVPQVHTQYSKGHPTSAILESLRTGDFSMVLMGTQGKSLISEIFLGSVAYNVARLASCPVLLLPREHLEAFSSPLDAPSP